MATDISKKKRLDPDVRQKINKGLHYNENMKVKNYFHFELVLGSIRENLVSESGKRDTLPKVACGFWVDTKWVKLVMSCP